MRDESVEDGYCLYDEESSQSRAGWTEIWLWRKEVLKEILNYMKNCSDNIFANMRYVERTSVKRGTAKNKNSDANKGRSTVNHLIIVTDGFSNKSFFINTSAFDRTYLLSNDHCYGWLFQEIFFY